MKEEIIKDDGEKVYVVDHLKVLATSWKAVWEKWRDHPFVKNVAKEHARDGNFSAVTVLNDVIERLLEERGN